MSHSKEDPRENEEFELVYRSCTIVEVTTPHGTFFTLLRSRSRDDYEIPGGGVERNQTGEELAIILQQQHRIQAQLFDEHDPSDQAIGEVAVRSLAEEVQKAIAEDVLLHSKREALREVREEVGLVEVDNIDLIEPLPFAQDLPFFVTSGKGRKLQIVVSPFRLRHEMEALPKGFPEEEHSEIVWIECPKWDEYVDLQRSGYIELLRQIQHSELSIVSSPVEESIPVYKLAPLVPDELKDHVQSLPLSEITQWALYQYIYASFNKELI